MQFATIVLAHGILKMPWLAQVNSLQSSEGKDMATCKDLWTRDQLFVAVELYCRTAFGKLDQSNPEIVRLSKLIGRSPSALAMKLSNLAGLDKKITDSGRSGLTGASNLDREIWAEVNADWGKLAIESQRALNAFATKSRDPPKRRIAN